MIRFIFYYIVNRYQLLLVCLSTCSMFIHSKTAAPTELRLEFIDETVIHLFVLGSYCSTALRLEEPSFPPMAYMNPSIATTSCVDLKSEQTYISVR